MTVYVHSGGDQIRAWSFECTLGEESDNSYNCYHCQDAQHRKYKMTFLRRVKPFERTGKNVAI